MYCKDEKKLVEACMSGNSKAQRALYDYYAPRMMSVAIRYMGDTESAQDVLQEAFIKVFTSLDTYTGIGALEGWIRRIVINVALEGLRRNDVLMGSVDLTEASASTVYPTVMDKLSADELMKIIASLPSGFRTVFNMYAIEGYSHKEIAEALGISEGTSRSQYNRARTLIQKKIEQTEG